MVSATTAYGTDLMWDRNKTATSVQTYWLYRHVQYISLHKAVPCFFRGTTEI